MKKLLQAMVKDGKERTIVVLTREKIVWYQISVEGDLKPISTQNDFNGSVHIPERYLFSDDTCQLIELVVDTPVDDLDRAKVVENTSRYLQRVQIIRALWNLKREYAESQILKLPKQYYPNIASILHTSLPENYQRVIESFQKHGLVVSHMTTTTQLVSVALTGAEPCLLVVPCGSSQHRLMLIDAGVVVFMRIVDVELGRAVESDANHLRHVEETLDYLIQANLIKSREVRVTTVDIPKNDPPSEISLENYLANTYLTGVASLMGEADYYGKPLNQESVEESLNANVKTVRIRLLIWFSRFRSSQRSWMKSKKNGSAFKPYRVTSNLLRHHAVLNHSRNLMRSYGALLILRRVTIALAVVTFLSVLMASIHSVRQIRGLNSLKENGETIEAEILQLKSMLNERYATPFFSAATLKGNKEFADDLKGSPQSVLTLVATLIQDFPSIQLQSLSWSILPSDSDEETVIASVINAAGRKSLLYDDSSQEKLLITFEGAFNPAESLRDKQQQLDLFSQSLSRRELVSNISIMDSPIESAGSSESFDDKDSHFSIRFWAALP